MPSHAELSGLGTGTKKIGTRGMTQSLCLRDCLQDLREPAHTAYWVPLEVQKDNQHLQRASQHGKRRERIIQAHAAQPGGNIAADPLKKIPFFHLLAAAFQQPELGEELVRKRNRKTQI